MFSITYHDGKLCYSFHPTRLVEEKAAILVRIRNGKESYKLLKKHMDYSSFGHFLSYIQMMVALDLALIFIDKGSLAAKLHSLPVKSENGRCLHFLILATEAIFISQAVTVLTLFMKETFLGYLSSLVISMLWVRGIYACHCYTTSMRSSNILTSIFTCHYYPVANDSHIDYGIQDLPSDLCKKVKNKIYKEQNEELCNLLELRT